MLTIHVPDEIETRFAPIAQATGKTTQAYLQAFLLECLEDLDDYQEAVQEYEKIKSGKSRLWTAEEVRNELGLDD